MAADPDLPAPDADPAPAVRRQGRTVVVGVALVALVFGGVALVAALGGGGQPAAGGTVPEDVASPAPFGLTDAVPQLPEATLAGFAGGPDVAVADWLGGPPLVINFWATWCAPCVAEMPDLQALHELGGDDLQLIGINVRDAPPNAERFVDDLGITYPQAVDAQEAWFRATGSFGMPTTLLVHPDGAVAYRHTGPLELDDVVGLVAEHLDVHLDVPPDAG